MDIKILREAAAAKLAEAKKLSSAWAGKEAEMPKDVVGQITALLSEHDDLKAKLSLAQQISDDEQFYNEPTELKAAHLGWRESAPEEGDTPVDVKAWREIEADTPWGGKQHIRFHVPLAVQSKGYASAFEAYLRKGWDNLGPQDRKTLTEGSDTSGGAFVPEDLQTEIIRKVAAAATMRALCRKVQTSRDIATWPRVNYTTDDIYTSGVRLTWTGEIPASSTTHRVTEPVSGQIKIPVHTAMASIPISNDLIEDSAFDVIGLSSDLMSEAYALGEDNAFLNGTGDAQPMGLLAQAEDEGPAAVHLKSTSVPTHAGLLALEAALPAQYERNARFMACKSTYNVLRTAAATTSGDLLWPVTAQYGYLPGMPPNLLGYPVVKNEFVPEIASGSYSLILGDFTGYAIVDRVGLSIRRIDDLYAETNATLLLARKRVGGYCVEPFRFKLGQMSD